MEYKRLGDVISIKKGKKIEQVEESENTIRYIQIDDLRNDDNIKFCEKNDKYVMVEKEDIIIAWDGANAGTVGFGLNGAIGSTLARLDINDDEIDTIYCAMFLRSKFKYLREKCTGATIPHLSRASLEDLKLPKPSLEIQKKIVEVLDKAQSLIDKKKEQINLLDELVKSRFIDIFGKLHINEKNWNEAIISDYCQVKGGKRVPKGEKLLDEKTEYPYLRVVDLKNGTVIEDDIKYINNEVYEKIKRYTISSNDVYLTNVGTVGIAGTIPEKFNNANLTENAVKLVFDNNLINKTYLAYYLNSDVCQNYILERKMTVGVPKLAIFRIETLPLILPPLELQNEFAEFVTKIDEIKSKMETSLSELEDNFNSLMQKSFKGEIF